MAGLVLTSGLQGLFRNTINIKLAIAVTLYAVDEGLVPLSIVLYGLWRLVGYYQGVNRLKSGNLKRLPASLMLFPTDDRHLLRH